MMRALPAAVLAIAYLFLHQPVQLAVQELRTAIGGTAFSRLFAAMGIVFLAGLVLAARAVAKRTRLATSDDGLHTLRSTLWVGTLIAIAAAHYFLVAVESELVHLPQYLLLYLAFHTWLRKPGEAAVWTGLVGIADEAYQFWHLQAHWNIYLDWNDVVLNLLAAALGCSCALSMGRWTRVEPLLWVRIRRSALLIGAVYGSTVALMSAGVLGLHRSAAPKALTHLSRSDAPAQFWTFADWSRKDFHILLPEEGLLLSLVLFVVLASIDAFVERSHESG